MLSGGEMSGFTIQIAEFNRNYLSRNEQAHVLERVQYEQIERLKKVRGEDAEDLVTKEEINVKNKRGENQVRKIDAEKNSVLSNHIKIISNKELTLDLFRDVGRVLGDANSKDKVNLNQFLRDKVARHSRFSSILKLNMAIKLKCLTGLAYLRCLLRRINLTKEYFLIEIQ